MVREKSFKQPCGMKNFQNFLSRIVRSGIFPHSSDKFLEQADR